jgi:hypothetical protein
LLALFLIEKMTDLSAFMWSHSMGRALSAATGVKILRFKTHCVGKIYFSPWLMSFLILSRKKKIIIEDLNELDYTELILLIDDKTNSGKVAFNVVKGCMS